MAFRTRLTLSLALLVGACGGAPTLKHLENTQYVFAPEKSIPDAPDKVTSAYLEYLKTAPQDRQRPEAMQRLGDLEMRTAEEGLASESGAKAGEHFRNAIAAYQDLLKAYPNYVATDQVLYQLARAQEQAGDIDASLQTLERLVAQFPASPFRDETQFRRGELFFARHDYVAAEQAYGAVLGSDRATPFRERARYMLGWTRFKQARMGDALDAFFDVLDASLADQRDEGPLEQMVGLSRAERELVEDALRVTGLCFANLQGAAAIPAYFLDKPKRRSYEFRVYQQLAETYLKQERSRDAGDTLAAFARNHPWHAQAPRFQARAADIYQRAGLLDVALQAKKDYAAAYGADSKLRELDPSGWERAQAALKSSLADLARHYHAAAQKGHKADDYRESAHWYRAYLASFPDDAQAVRTRFMLAEALFENRQFAEATSEYEHTAYRYPPHDKAADAGYTALLAYAEQVKQALPADVDALRRNEIDSALRFARAFGGDPRAGPVLADAAEQLYGKLHDGKGAVAVAQQLLALVPPAAAPQQRAAWTLIGHTAFDGGVFARAEKGYNEALALAPKNDKERDALTERLAASIYKQGEQARNEGRLRDAAAQFMRVGSVTPTSSIRATAQYDAAAALIGLEDWAAATSALEDFRRRFPGNALQGEVTAKLAVAYLAQARGEQAALEFERVATAAKDAGVARDALWQAADLHQKAGHNEAATKAFAHYVSQYPEPLEAAEEARDRLAHLAREAGNASAETAWTKQLLDADRAGGSARSERTRYLGATAALALAAPVYAEYRKVALVEPLKQQLKLKKAKLEEVLKAYAVATDYGIADVATAATFQVAELYRDFGRSLVASQRPARLSGDALEQYNLMLDEQAFPFEEKAIELHELNARRAAGAIYDQWVQQSFAALAQLNPVRYGKTEHGEAAAPAPVEPSVEREQASHSGPQRAEHFNRLGIAYRQKGQFGKAQAAYEQAIALDAGNADAVLNLGILFDLYLWDSARALEHYKRYRTLAAASAGDESVARWIVDIENRRRRQDAAGLSRKEEQ